MLKEVNRSHQREVSLYLEHYMNPQTLILHIMFQSQQGMLKRQEEESKSYQPPKPQKRLSRTGRGRQMTKKAQGDNNTYGWDEVQSYFYVIYLDNFREVFEEPLIRQKIRVFRRMAELITTRTSQQIKSHHQKMMKKHHGRAKEAVYCLTEYLKGRQLENPDFGAQIEALNARGMVFMEREKPWMAQQLGEMLVRMEKGGQPMSAQELLLEDYDHDYLGQALVNKSSSASNNAGPHIKVEPVKVQQSPE